VSTVAELPTGVAAAVALLVLLGAAFALLGSIGLLRLRSFYERIHPPTLGTTFGTGFTCLASALLFSWLESRSVVQELALVVFVIVTTPITFTLLLRAAVRRDEGAEGKAAVEEQQQARSGGPRPP
jgi:multicomponent K+:H+ antiporter subunit G